MRENYVTVNLTPYECDFLVNVLNREIETCEGERDRASGKFRKIRENDAEFANRIAAMIIAESMRTKTQGNHWE